MPAAGRGGEDQACASSAFPRPPRSARTRPSPTCSPPTSPSTATRSGFARPPRRPRGRTSPGRSSASRSPRVAKGLIASGVEAGDRVALQAKTRYEWTVLRLRHLDRRRRRRPDLRDLQRRPGRLDPLRLRRHAPLIVETRRARRRRRVRPRPGARPRSPVCVIDDDAVGTLTAGRQGRRRQRARRAPRKTLHGRQRRHADLHQRHHRPAQGLRAHPRELPVRDRQRHDACSAASSTSTGSILLFIPLAHVLARVHRRSARSRPARSSATPPDVKNLLDDLGEFKPTFVLAVPRVFEKVFNPAKAKAEADGKGKIFDTRRPGGHRLVPGPGHRRRRPGAQGPAHAVRQAGLRASCGPPSAASASARSPAAPRSATGSATSSAASASPSTRATASPRRPPPPR